MSAHHARLGGTWCLGHGVDTEAPSLRNGHYVERRYAAVLFSNRDGDARASKGFARTHEPRCTICRSIKRRHDHEANARRRAREFRAGHAKRWVKLGRASSEVAVLEQMDIGGVTESALTELILAHIGEPCPGLCLYETGEGLLIVHRIETVADMHIDVKDPLQPFTIENIGILCDTCNPAKRDTPWAVFIYARRAARAVWEAAIRDPSYRGREQPRLPGLKW